MAAEDQRMTEPGAQDDMSDLAEAAEYDDDMEPDCLICGGDGYLFGEDMGDPLWYSADEVVTCKSCGGSGLRKDMAYW
jgi:hypothetical protein